jgi:tape measure domain-containing protein
MTFDNASFQKKTADTLASLKKLQDSMNFSGAKAGFQKISDAAAKVNVTPVKTEIDKVNQGVVASTATATAAIFNLTNRAVNAGITIAKALTIDPLTAGFQEYETNMNSIQTILANTASKGTSLEQVNAALDQMNEYSDKTIYNFSQMAKNVGTFTAAGVDLDTSVSAIKGIANLAAVSGSSSEQASTAMYQLSQAIAAGSVKLMDWNSVVNAGMGGEVFKNALVQTASALGTINKVPLGQTFKEWETANGSFRETLKDGWVTAEVLTTTLGAISGDLDAIELSNMGFTDDQVVQMVKLGESAVAAATEVKTLTQLTSTVKESIGSGWAQSFRTVIGDFKEAKALFTGLNNFFGEFIGTSAKARNDLLNGWKFLGGRDTLMQGLLFSLAAVKSALSPIAQAFRDVFPRKTGFDLLAITTGFRDFAKSLILSGSAAKTVKQIFRAVFSIFKIGFEIIKGLFSVVGTLAKVFFSLVGIFSGVAGSSGDFISKITDLLVGGGLIAKVFDSINWVLLRFADGIMWVRDRLSDLTQFFTGGIIGEKFSEAFSSLGGIFDAFKRSLSGIGQALKPAGEAIRGFFGILGGAAGGAGGVVGSGVAKIFTTIAEAIITFANFVSSAISKLGTKAIPFLTDVATGIGGFFTMVAKAVGGAGGIFGILSTAGAAIQEFFVSLYVGFAETDIGETIQDTLDTVKDFFTSLYATMTGIDIGGAASGAASGVSNFFQTLWGNVSNIQQISTLLDSIRTSITNFFSSVFNSTQGSGEGIKKAFGDLGETLGRFAGNLWDTISAGLGKVGEFLSNVFSSIFGSIKSAGGGVSDAIGGFMENIGAAFETKNLNKILAVVGTGLFAVLVNSFRRIAKNGFKLDFGLEPLIESLTGLADKFSDTLDVIGGAIKTFQNNMRADTLLKIGLAMAVLTASIVVLTLLDPQMIAISLGAVAVGVGTLVGALALLSKIEANPVKTVALGASMMLLSASVLILAGAIYILSKMDPKTFTDGMIRVALALAAFVALAYGLSQAQGQLIRAAISLGILSLSLMVFAKTIDIYSGIDMGVLAKGTSIIAGILVTFGVLSNIVDGSAMIKFALGLGVSSFALRGLAKVIGELGSLPFEQLRNGLFGMVVVLGALVGSLRLMPDEKKSRAGTIALLGMAAALWVMAKAIETIGRLGTGGVIQSVLAFVVVIGLLVGSAMLLSKFGVGVGPIITLSVALAIFAAAITALGQLDIGQVLIALGALAGIFLVIGAATILLTPLVPALTALGAALFIAGAGFALFGIGVALTGAGLAVLGKVGPKALKNLAKGLIEVIKLFPQIAAALAKGFVEFIRTIGKSAGQIADAIGDLLIQLLEKIQEILPVIGETAGVLIETLLTLLEEKIPRLIEVGLKLLIAFLTGIRNNIGQIVTLGLEIMSNFLNGITAGIPLLGAAIRLLITVVVNEIVLAIPILINAGVSILVALINGIRSAVSQIVTAITDLIVTIIVEIGNNMQRITDAGFFTLVSFLWGLTNNVTYLTGEVKKMFDQILDALEDLIIGDNGIVDSAVDFVEAFLAGMVDRSIRFGKFSGDLIIKLLNSIEKFIRDEGARIRRAGWGIADAIIDGITGGLSNRVDDVLGAVRRLAGNVIDTFKGVINSDSPSKVFIGIAEDIGNGLAIGLSNDSKVKIASKGLAESTIKSFGEAMSGLKYDLQDLDEFNPTITPVLDLTRVANGAKGLSGLLSTAPISASLSARQASAIASAQGPSRQDSELAAAAPVREIKFEQIINSPTALTTDDIYRSTRNQIALAKEELKIP